jgi:hypothetical protein
MPRLRSLPEQPVMRDVYRAYQETCRPLGVLTEAAMRGRSPFTQGPPMFLGSTLALIVMAPTSAWPKPVASRQT